MRRQRKDPFDTKLSHRIWISFLVVLVVGVFVYIYVLPSGGTKITDGMRTPTPIPFQDIDRTAATPTTEVPSSSEATSQ